MVLGSDIDLDAEPDPQIAGWSMRVRIRWPKYPRYRTQPNCGTYIFQGASKEGKCPDGSSYVEAAEKEEIRALLR